MARKSRKGGNSRGGGGFLVMSVSLNLILVIFFVYLNSIGVDDKDKTKKALGSLVGKFGMLPSGLQISEGKKLLLPGPSFVSPKRGSVDYAKEFRKIIKEGISIPEEVTVLREGNNLIINMADKVLFSPGKSEIVPEGIDLLEKLAPILRKQSNPIRIEGYTDNVPISTERFPSNWELSAARATAVYRFLAETGGIGEERMTAIGYGKYRPLLPNDSTENRARNRRVRIVFDSSGD
ncbi:MAG: flagellar motor protein MotB [Nitrospiria bacterium]